MVDVKVFIGCISSSGHSQQFFLGEGKGILRVKYVKNGRELGKTYRETLVSERVIKALQKWEWVWTEELLYKMGFNSLQNLKIALFNFSILRAFLQELQNRTWSPVEFFLESKWQPEGWIFITPWLKVGGGRDKKWVSFIKSEIMQILQKVLEEMCKALIGFMVLSLSLKGYFVSITLCWTL